MNLQRVQNNTPILQILDILERDGGLVIEGIFPTEVIEQLREDLVKAESSFHPGQATQGLGADGKTFVGANTIRFSRLGQLSPAYFDLLENEIYAAIADAVLLPNCGSYWVNTAQAMMIGPGEPAQMLHRDCDNWPQHVHPTWPDSSEITVSAMIALDEVTEELGATRVIPGSNHWTDLSAHGDSSQTVPAEMKPGDALIYSGKTIHGGGENLTTDKWRRAMHLSFVVGWLTPEECNPIDYSEHELAERSPRVQQLLGHRSYDPRPRRGGGLWLRNANKIEDQSGNS